MAVLFKNAMWKKNIRSCCLTCVYSRHYLMYRRMWCRFSLLIVRRDESCIWVATIKSETYAVDICHHSYVLTFKKLIFDKLLCEWIHLTKTHPGSISPQNQLKKQYIINLKIEKEACIGHFDRKIKHISTQVLITVKRPDICVCGFLYFS